MIYKNDPFFSPYGAERTLSYGQSGVVATSQPIAAQIGLDILKQGGNAIDAAIATAAALTLVEPTGCGIGGDAFAIVWFKDKMYGLNASGVAPDLLTPEAVKAQGFDKIPTYGWAPVTVPGVPAAWAELSEKFGALPFEQVLAPAIKLAEDGFVVTPTVALLWKRGFDKFKDVVDADLVKHWYDLFSNDKKQAPQAGEVFKSLDHANTLKQIANTKAAAFYKGEIADTIDKFSKDTGGFLRKSDLEKYQPSWVDPISVNYKGYDVWEIPPNGQGLVALIALNTLKNDTFTARDSVETFHLQCEAMKLAFADGKAFITDPKHMQVSCDELLSDNYGKTRRASITSKATLPAPGKPQAGGTVYLATADKDGNMVSFIQSNYHGFGSGVVVPGTGISLQNRGETYSLNSSDANYLEAGKKTYHTIIPGFLTKDGQALGPFGVMGGFMQPQGHFQVVMNMVDFGLSPQAALDAPRWQWLEGNKIGVEKEVPNYIIQGLQAKGHEIEVAADRVMYGRGQIILRNLETGVYSAGTESRCDGYVASY